MKLLARYVALLITGFSLGLSVTNSLAQSASAAETACMVAVNDNYGGNVQKLNIISSEFSQAGSLVFLDADGERWRCLASNEGQVGELSVEEAAGDNTVVADMSRYCIGEASAEFGQHPQDISTQPALEEDGGMYSVFGQFPPSGADPTVFICTFSAEGKFIGIDEELIV